MNAEMYGSLLEVYLRVTFRLRSLETVAPRIDEDVGDKLCHYSDVGTI